MNDPAFHRIYKYCMQRLETEPLKTRVEIYRALSEAYPDEKTSLCLADLADTLDRAHHLQLTLDLTA